MKKTLLPFLFLQVWHMTSLCHGKKNASIRKEKNRETLTQKYKLACKHVKHTRRNSQKTQEYAQKIKMLHHQRPKTKKHTDNVPKRSEEQDLNTRKASICYRKKVTSEIRYTYFLGEEKRKYDINNGALLVLASFAQILSGATSSPFFFRFFLLRTKRRNRARAREEPKSAAISRPGPHSANFRGRSHGRGGGGGSRQE